MTLPPLKVCKRIRQLFRSIGDPNANVAATARDKLFTLLTQHALSWNDIPACIAEADAADASRTPKPAPPSAAGPGPEIDVLDLVLHLIELHIAISPTERLAVALWILHTYVFDRFDITPRLAALSPASGCGKTALLILLDLLTADSYRTDNISPATIYHLLDRGSHTLLIDEADNLGLLANPLLRALFNSGHRRGGAISRFINGRPQRYPTFAPPITGAHCSPSPTISGAERRHVQPRLPCAPIDLTKIPAWCRSIISAPSSVGSASIASPARH